MPALFSYSLRAALKPGPGYLAATQRAFPLPNCPGTCFTLLEPWTEVQWHTPFLFLYLGMGRLLSLGGSVYFSPGKFLLSHTTILVGSPPTQLFPGLYPVTFTAALRS